MMNGGMPIECGGGFVSRVLFDIPKCHLLRSFSTVLLSIALIAGPLAATASAQSWFSPWGSSWERGWRLEGDRAPRRGYRDGPPRQRRSPAPDKRSTRAAATPVGPIVAIISLADQRIHVYDGDNLLAQSKVSTGSRGYRTPTGVFSVIQKRRYHESNIYSGAPMPWMQRITWSGIALHGGVVPGYPASHGCVRLTYDFAPKMWDMTKVGARVIVSPRDVAPVAIVHPRLPAPALTPMTPNVAASDQNVRSVAVEVASGEQGRGRVDTTAGQADVTAAIVAAGQRETPMQRARAAKAKALAGAKATQAAMKSALATARATSAQARAASAGLRKARMKVASAERRLAAAERASKSAVQANANARAVKAETDARAGLVAAQEALPEVAVLEAIQARIGLDSAREAMDATAAYNRAADALKSWARGLDPISVFVSRREGRIFVRQGLAPLFDGAVIIRDPDQLLGTHVFTAVAEEEGGARLRWSVVTIPNADTNRKAAEALDRVDIPPEIGAKIADRLWVGASLIISDQGLSGETGFGTDFVVLTKQ